MSADSGPRLKPRSFFSVVDDVDDVAPIGSPFEAFATKTPTAAAAEKNDAAWKDQFRNALSASVAALDEPEKDQLSKSLKLVRMFEDGSLKQTSLQFDGHLACQVGTAQDDPNLWCKCETETCVM